jgi:hypothetical protein
MQSACATAARIRFTTLVDRLGGAARTRTYRPVFSAAVNVSR